MPSADQGRVELGGPGPSAWQDHGYVDPLQPSEKDPLSSHAERNAANSWQNEPDVYARKDGASPSMTVVRAGKEALACYTCSADMGGSRSDEALRIERGNNGGASEAAHTEASWLLHSASKRSGRSATEAATAMPLAPCFSRV